MLVPCFAQPAASRSGTRPAARPPRQRPHAMTHAHGTPAHDRPARRCSDLEFEGPDHTDELDDAFDDDEDSRDDDADWPK